MPTHVPTYIHKNFCYNKDSAVLINHNLIIIQYDAIIINHDLIIM